MAHRTRAPSAWLFQEIQWRRRLEQVLLRDMEIAQRRPYAGMAQQPLDGMEVCPRFQEMGGKRVAQAMNASGFDDPCPPFGGVKMRWAVTGERGRVPVWLGKSQVPGRYVRQ